jgi:hypothetical protein
MIDVAACNSFILFEHFRKLHPEVPALHRPASYLQLQYREEVIKQLGDIDDADPVPLCMLSTKVPPAKAFTCHHLPEYDQENRPV